MQMVCWSGQTEWFWHARHQTVNKVKQEIGKCEQSHNCTFSDSHYHRGENLAIYGRTTRKRYSICAVVATGTYLVQWWCYNVQGAHAGSKCYRSRRILSATEGRHKVATSTAAMLGVCCHRQQQLEAQVERQSIHWPDTVYTGDAAFRRQVCLVSLCISVQHFSIAAFSIVV